jgi:hypothetical protein
LDDDEAHGRYPQIIEAGAARDWAWAAHGRTNSTKPYRLHRLYADAGTSGRVMPLALHPFVIGQAFRARYLDEAAPTAAHTRSTSASVR